MMDTTLRGYAISERWGRCGAGHGAQKQNVLISDSDTVWLRDPRGFLEEGPFATADVLVSTDCIDTTADEICNIEYCGCVRTLAIPGSLPTLRPHCAQLGDYRV